MHTSAALTHSAYVRAHTLDASVCLQDGESAPKLAWRLDYEKSSVFFSSDLTEGADGVLLGKGDVYAMPRADPSKLAKVGQFSARRLGGAWDLRDPVVARRVTNKIL